jgi:hypothetical protein
MNVPVCPSDFVGDVKPVQCGSMEPLLEPNDLEKSSPKIGYRSQATPAG